MVDIFRLASKYFGRAAAAIPAFQQQANKALHPTAASLVLFAAFLLYSKLVVIGRRRVSLVVGPPRLLLCVLDVLKCGFDAFLLWCGLAAFGFVVGAVLRLWRRFWFSGGDTFRLWSKLAGGAAGGGSNLSTAAQQGAAPDRRQFGSFYSVSALLLVGRDWAAAGELSRCVAARGLDGSAVVFGLFALDVAALSVLCPLTDAFLWFRVSAAFRLWCSFWFCGWRGLVALA